MKAIIYTMFGPPDVLQLKDVDQPAPADDRVLVKVHAASVNALDMHTIRSSPTWMRLVAGNGWRKPKDQRVGVDLAGRVVAVGRAVTQFQVGDAIYGRGPGAFAEFACPRATSIAPKPANLTFAQAAAVPVAAITALQGLRDHGHIQAGQQVLIQGAGGGVGTFAVQLAKAFGAEVTATCGPHNVDMVKSLGADHVLDYTQTNFTKTKQKYDLILAVNGYYPLRVYRRALRPHGHYVMAGAAKDRLLPAISQVMLQGPVISRFGGKKLRNYIANPQPSDLAFLTELLESGKIVPVIDRQYPLQDAAAAVKYMEEGHARGKIVITVDHADAV